jgi:hypothetical protein
MQEVEQGPGLLGCLGMLLAVTVVLAILLIGAWGGPSTYYRCGHCQAAFCSPAWKHGFPGQFDMSNCRYCRGVLVECSKEKSGWIDGTPDDGK